MAEFIPVGSADEIGEGEARGYEANGEQIAVARVGGNFYGFSDICTHRRCNLAMGGEIEGTNITCECHGSTFDMTTGAVVTGPATEPIATYSVREENGQIQVAV